MSRKDLVPVVTYSWFPFPGTRGENTWGSRATKRSWVHVEEGEALELVMQAVYFCVRFEGGREQGPQPFAAEASLLDLAALAALSSHQSVLFTTADLGTSCPQSRL